MMIPTLLALGAHHETHRRCEHTMQTPDVTVTISMLFSALLFYRPIGCLVFSLPGWSVLRGGHLVDGSLRVAHSQ